jgi:transcriptional regulator with XRE-family HTH domain
MEHKIMKLKALRVNKGLTAKQVAKIIGKTERTVQNWENGYVRIPLNSATELAKLYDYPLQFIQEAQ